MRLIKLQHWRCDEPSAYTLIFAPIEWTDEEISNSLSRAQDKYLGAIKLSKEKNPPPFKNFFRYSMPDYEKHPNKTVKEVKEEHNKKKAVYDEWRKKQDTTRKSFTSYLTDEGFTSIWEGIDEDDVFAVEWGHRHGQSLDYEDTQTDTLPKPDKY